MTYYVPEILCDANTQVLLARIDALATDIGRLRRRRPADPLLERIAFEVETIDAIVHPCAAELTARYRRLRWHEEAAVEEALAEVDARSAHLRRLLASEPPA